MEGTEKHQWLLGGHLGWITTGGAGQVLPPVEVHMGFQIRLPGILHSGLERENQHTFGPEFFGELIGGEGLAETHLGIPEEARNRLLVLVQDRLIVGVGFLDRIRLLTPHRKILVTRSGEFLPTA